MKIFIDTSSNWNSGFETHLTQFLINIDKLPIKDEIIIYGHIKLISKIKHLAKNVNFVIDNNIPKSAFNALMWRKKYVPKLINHYSPDIHFNMMGWMQHRNENITRISMNRNLQPFIPEAVSLSSVLSKEYIRLKLYKKTILKSYNNCHGVIFNSTYAHNIVKPFLDSSVKTIVINHGVNEKFFNAPRLQTKTDDLSLLYISDFYPYKNQEILIQAVDELRKSSKLNLKLNLVGELNNSARKRIDRVLKRVDNPSNWLKLHNRVDNNELISHFLSNDIFIFVSSVESFGHTLVEAMAAGMPIICSDKRPMKDFLGEYAFTVDEKNKNEIALKILEFVKNPILRFNNANDAYKRAQNFSYEKMTIDTLNFLRSFITN